MRIDGHTRLAAVVAHPIKHSISPFIMNHAFEMTKVNGVYVAWDIAEKDLAETVANIRRYDMFGINLSMPYKQAVIPYLDELTPAADLIGAVNTVVNDGGKLIGYNTDTTGFFASLPQFDIKDKTMTILGAGGAAAAIITQAALTGVSRIYVFTRQLSMTRVAPWLDKVRQKTQVEITHFPIEETALLQAKVNQSDLFVNATSVGMDGRTSLVGRDFEFKSDLLVADVIYQPFETPFLRLARRQACQTVNGLGMLLYQAASAFELWTHHPMPTDRIWQHLVTKFEQA